MAYVHVTFTKGQTLERYQQISDLVGELGPEQGNLAHLVGADDQGLHVVDIWESKAHADRFAAEQLFPAFAAAGMTPAEMGNTEIRDFEAAVSSVAI
ncbi:MAG TPA: hypothetical protein VMT43_02170 [Acidimicrobiales bacterium]|nr:hypothetical protein [Acidimicrobiales bacterium]